MTVFLSPLSILPFPVFLGFFPAFDHFDYLQEDGSVHSTPNNMDS